MTKQSTGRGIRNGLALLVTAALAGVAMPSSAQNVPVPKPAPKARDGGVQMSAQGAPKAPTTTGTTPQAAPNPVIPDPRRNVPANIFSSFDANQKAQAAKVSAYLSSLQALIGTSRLMLMIGTKDGQLKQWTVTDPQGYDTTIAVYNLDTSKKVDPGLFKIDFTNYPTSPG